MIGAQLVPWLTCAALAMAAAGCGGGRKQGETATGPTAAAWPDSFAAHLGETVTLEGTAVDAKLGALLLGEGGAQIWIDGVDAWPQGFYKGGDQGAHVRVTGVVIERADLPVFVATDGGLPVAGMPVPPGTDVEAARHRFLLSKATWTVLD